MMLVVVVVGVLRLSVLNCVSVCVVVDVSMY